MAGDQTRVFAGVSSQAVRRRLARDRVVLFPRFVGQLLASFSAGNAKDSLSLEKLEAPVSKAKLFVARQPLSAHRLGGQQPVMLRSALYAGTALPLAPRVGSFQAHRLAVSRPRCNGQRYFADAPKSPGSTKESIFSSDPAFIPGSASSQAPAKTPVPLGPISPAPGPASSSTPTIPSSASTIPPENVPKVPPPPPSRVQTAPPSGTPSAPSTPPPASSPPPPPPPPTATPAPKRRWRRLRALLYITVFSGVAYGAAVFYALRNDNFHDFFTEYIPFGEESVLYFEERSFRKRFPHARHTHTREASPSRPDAKNVTIPQKAGLSWRVKDEGDQTGSDLTQKGRHMSALDTNTSGRTSSAQAQQQPEDATNKEKSAAVDSAKKSSSVQAAASSSEKKKAAKSAPAPASKPEIQPESKPEQKPEPKLDAKPEMTAQPSPATPTPRSDPRPPAIAPVTQISSLQVPDADEPLVQELVKIVNDIITVVNADSADAPNKYSAPINKAKDSLATVGKKIIAMKEAERKVAEEKVSQAHKEFDEGAKELLRRIDAARQEDDAKFREEFEVEREKISHNYEEKLSTELERSQQLAEQRLKNELAEQAIELKRRFISDIKTLVEEERNGRLSKLSDLSTNVDDLQKLTSNWNGIIDSNLATQKLQVAVDAVRASLASGMAGDDRPKPFVREMAALKLVANGDPVVDAAIASVNPTAYQRGIPSPAQLIDRFRRVAAEVRKASLLPKDAGIASHAASLLLSKAMFKKQGQPQGSDVESVLARTETMLEEGDLDGAAREINTLQGWAGVLSKDWLQDCRKVLEVRQALDVIEAEARLQCLRVE